MFTGVLFDLDGTLLPLDLDTLVREYMKAVVGHMAPVLPPERLLPALLQGTLAMISHTDRSQTNQDAFFADFFPNVGATPADLMPHFDAFYRDVFPSLRRLAVSGGPGRPAVAAALARGCRVVLATNPLFPLSAVVERMRWAAVDDLPWELVTSYEEMHACKPSAAYYEEILQRTGLRPEECLMVGNDVAEDMAPARALGMSTFLVTGYELNATGTPYTGPSGTLADLADRLRNLG